MVKNEIKEGKRCSKQQQRWWWWWQSDYRQPGELKTFIAHLYVTWPSTAQHPIRYSQIITAHQQQRWRGHAPPAPPVMACTCFPVTSLLWLSTWDIRRDADTSCFLTGKVSCGFVQKNGTRWSESPTTRERRSAFSCQVRKLLTFLLSFHGRWE